MQALTITLEPLRPPSRAVLEQLRQQYVLTTLYDEITGVIGQAGITLSVNRPGITANPAGGTPYTRNFYMRGGKLTPERPSAKRAGGKSLPPDRLVVGEKVYVIGIDTSDDSVTFHVQTATPSPRHPMYLVYRAAVTFQFPKGYVAPENLKNIIDTVREVFAVAAPSPLQILGTFANSTRPGEELRLNPDGSFSLTEGGRSYTGRFAAGGGRLVLRVSETGGSIVATVQDGRLIDSAGQTWVPEDDRQ